ncbi:MAG: 16S rRNA (uracil(1498)-N(3))-methyltransferase [Pirellulaceae bacterium]|nr:16S rRNA (uracil(1498)-N(3))-methyltransferase [Pirellulaceae bacterium]
MLDRYFLETRVTGPRTALIGSEARHLARVMRAQRGDRVTLFDGTGREFLAEVVQLRRNEVDLEILDTTEIDRELPFRLTIAVALPKGDRQRWLVEKMVELGVTGMIPLRTTRSVAQPSEGGMRRMTQWVIDASKQCGRNRLMEIAEPRTWPELLATSAAVPLRVAAHPGGETTFFESCFACDTSETLAAVGPEGGFTDEEIAAARDAAWRVVALGHRILRVETAALCLAVRLACRGNEPGSSKCGSESRQ